MLSCNPTSITTIYDFLVLSRHGCRSKKRRNRHARQHPKLLAARPHVQTRRRCCRARRVAAAAARSLPSANHTLHNAKLVGHLLLLERTRPARQRRVPRRLRVVRRRLRRDGHGGRHAVVVRRRAHKGLDCRARRRQRRLVRRAERRREAPVGEACVEEYRCRPAGGLAGG